MYMWCWRPDRGSKTFRVRGMPGNMRTEGSRKTGSCRCRSSSMSSSSSRLRSCVALCSVCERQVQLWQQQCSGASFWGLPPGPLGSVAQ